MASNSLLRISRTNRRVGLAGYTDLGDGEAQVCQAQSSGQSFRDSRPAVRGHRPLVLWQCVQYEQHHDRVRHDAPREFTRLQPERPHDRRAVGEPETDEVTRPVVVPPFLVDRRLEHQLGEALHRAFSIDGAQHCFRVLFAEDVDGRNRASDVPEGPRRSWPVDSCPLQTG